MVSRVIKTMMSCYTYFDLVFRPCDAAGPGQTSKWLYTCSAFMDFKTADDLVKEAKASIDEDEYTATKSQIRQFASEL